MPEPSEKRILITDDDEEVAELLNFAVRNEKFQTSIAGGGSEALKLIKTINFDLVILDLHMPVVDGFKVLEQLQTYEYKKIPVIILTGEKEEKELSKLMLYDANIQEVLIKPPSISFVISRIHGLLGTAVTLKDKGKVKETLEKESKQIEQILSDTFIEIKDSQLRKHPRISLNVATEIYDSSGNSKIGEGFIKDFSEGGIAVETEIDIEVETKINVEPECELNIKTSKAGLELNFSGKIVRKKKLAENYFLYGLMYSRMNDGDKEGLHKKIQDWLVSRKRKSYES